MIPIDCKVTNFVVCKLNSEVKILFSSEIHSECVDVKFGSPEERYIVELLKERIYDYYYLL